MTAKPLDRCFLAIDQRGDYLTIEGVLLAANRHQVALEDAGVDHRIALDLEQEDRVVADEVDRQGQDLFDMLCGQDRRAGSDATENGDVTHTIVLGTGDQRPLHRRS